MSECNCTLAKRAVGDGCSVCNPTLALEYAHGTIDDLNAEIVELQRHIAMLVRAINNTQAWMKHRGMKDHDLDAALLATSAQSAAWLEAKHIEWIGNPIEVLRRETDGKDEFISVYALPTKAAE